MKLRNIELKSFSTFPYIKKICVQNYVHARDRLELEKQNNQNIIISIYRNMSISQGDDNKVSYTAVNNKLSLEVYKPTTKIFKNPYIGWVQEITIIINAAKINRIFNTDTSFLETYHFNSPLKLPLAFEQSITDIFASQNLKTDNNNFELLLSELLGELELGRLKIIKTGKKAMFFKVKSKI